MKLLLLSNLLGYIYATSTDSSSASVTGTGSQSQTGSASASQSGTGSMDWHLANTTSSTPADLSTEGIVYISFLAIPIVAILGYVGYTSSCSRIKPTKANR
jgi:hypothetical protein